MPAHDYSDSDDEPGPSRAASSTHSPRANTRVKLTFARPNLTHLMNDPSPPSREGDQPGRSSLSPPPPLTLRLGPRPTANMPSAASSSKAGSNAHYSDSSDEDEAKPPPAKKAKKSKSKTQLHAASDSPSSSTTTTTAAAGAGPTGSGEHAVPAPKRSKYDWLQPSTVGASHHGPPERAGSTSIAKSTSGSGSGSGGWAPGEGIIAQVAGENEPRPEKKISLKVNSKPPGPGKAWRKGVKNGQPRPNAVHAYTPEGFSVPHSPSHSVTTEQVQPSRMLSPESTSDIYGSNAAPVPAALISRPPSPPFVLADASKLGIPVFKQPIAPPKFNLTLFPKVSPWFAPINGGDVGAFPRKEHVRKWGQNQKTFVGIGGGTLKFTTWTKAGPPSELSRLVRADKEAKDILGANAREAAKKLKPAQGPTGPASVAGSTAAASPAPERPSLMSLVSSESTPTISGLDAATEDATSEVGDGEESVVSTGAPRDGIVTPSLPLPPAPPQPKRKVATKPKVKAGPRKSKLAQEIHPTPPSEEGTATDAIEDIM